MGKNMFNTMVVVAFVWGISSYAGEYNFYNQVRGLTNWAEVSTYIQSLSEDEIWQLADQVRDEQGVWQAYPSSVFLGLYYGENWERNTPTLEKVQNKILDKGFSSDLRGALAASGFEIGRAWKIEDRLQYFDVVIPLLGQSDIPAHEKNRIGEYSYRAFSRCLSEVQSLADTNETKNILLNTCHARAEGMMKALSTGLESTPKEQADNTMPKALEDYASTYEDTEFPNTPQLKEAVDEAAKVRSLMRQHKKN